MGICACISKEQEQAQKAQVNINDLKDPPYQNQNPIHRFEKEQTDQTNVLENEKNLIKFSPLSQKKGGSEEGNVAVQNIVARKITSSKIKNKNIINIVILGASNVGKSAFLIKLTESTFEKLYIPTIYCEVKTKVFSFNTHNYKLSLTDTASNDYKEDYTKIYNNTDFFLVFYDVTSYPTFSEAKNIINNEINKYLSFYDEIPNICVVGNKTDESNKKVKTDEVSKYCNEHKYSFYEISVKTNKNVNQMMQEIVKVYDKIAYKEN